MGPAFGHGRNKPECRYADMDLSIPAVPSQRYQMPHQ
jgi:hypothetical protein